MHFILHLPKFSVTVRIAPFQPFQHKFFADLHRKIFKNSEHLSSASVSCCGRTNTKSSSSFCTDIKTPPSSILGLFSSPLSHLWCPCYSHPWLGSWTMPRYLPEVHRLSPHQCLVWLHDHNKHAWKRKKKKQNLFLSGRSCGSAVYDVFFSPVWFVAFDAGWLSALYLRACVIQVQHITFQLAKY